MSDQENSIFVPAADVQAVKTAIATIKAKLLFLARISDDEGGRGHQPGPGRADSNSVLLAPSPVVSNRLPGNPADLELALEEDLISVLIEFVSMAEELVSEVDQANFPSESMSEGNATSMAVMQPLEPKALGGGNISLKEIKKIPLPPSLHPDENN